MPIISFLDLTQWNPESGTVWKEIVTRWGKVEYSDPIKRKEHQDTLESEWNTKKYSRDRAKSYPSVGDQLDMMMKDMKNGTTTHQEACEAVKDKYPKP